jgi:hypothetical protein
LVAATAIGSKAIFAGGIYNGGAAGASDIVDVHNSLTNSW